MRAMSDIAGKDHSERLLVFAITYRQSAQIMSASAAVVVKEMVLAS